jgi:hypothetical protein
MSKKRPKKPKPQRPGWITAKSENHPIWFDFPDDSLTDKTKEKKEKE